MCPNCCAESIPVPGLILSDVNCEDCGKTIGVQWLFRTVFSLVMFATSAVVGFVVLVDQGLYAAILMISFPIGAIGFIKARFCPLVTRRRARHVTAPPSA